MKKRNFITGFSAAFVASIALISCGGIKSRDNVVLTINGKPYTAKELYEEQKTPAAAEAKFNAVYKVAVRRYFEKDQEGHIYMEEITRETKLKIAGAKEEARNNASKSGQKYDVEWKKILTSNGVENEQGLYDKFEYDLEKTKFEEKIYDRQFDGKTNGESNYDVLRDGGYLKDYKGNEVDTGKGKIPGYLKTKMPYHMKHILVKISGGKENDDAYTEITTEEARKITDIITELAKGTSFEDLASNEKINDDESARKNRGSLGIMSRDTQFVNDFKLGTYLFESYFSNMTNKDITGEDKTTYNPTNAKKAIFGDTLVEGTASDYADKIVKLNDRTSATNSDSTKAKLGRIPFGVIQQLVTPTADNACKLYEMDLTNKATAERFKGVDVKAKYYPRNIIFNKYFNKHNIMVITNSKAPKYDYGNGTTSIGDSADYIKTDNNVIKRGVGEDKYFNDQTGPAEKTTPTDDGKAGFKDAEHIKNKADVMDFIGVTQGTTKENVLCDENGRIVLVFRSGSSGSKSSNDTTGYQGIHFVVIERSPFIGNEYDEYYEGSTFKRHEDATTLQDYYTQYYPDETNGHHPKYAYAPIDNKKTYVNYFVTESDPSKLKERATTVKSELKKADANLNTYVFDYLMKKGEITFNQSSEVATDLQGTIEKWITNTKRDYTTKTDTRKWNETWQTYYDNLELRNENRSYDSTRGERLVPEALVKVFTGEATLKYTYKEGETTKYDGTYYLKDVFGKEGAYNE